MDIILLTNFLKWCSVLNIGILCFSSLMFMLAPDFIYRVHGRLFTLERTAFNTQIYQFLAIYKILILVFNLTPYIALLIIQ
ncbi:Uncharacterised protein [Zhongshania aliphaticivorans]|uniref:DUF6868 domain-containing protein n=1 Tax=Zhongshania aliphaticivorans TaxID=1470434 RepID=A0A5S9NPL0_9GAMM|nr:Uncharacterised protein [Zhongshania aliphaticivorans]CAA0109588.1 Uncharacterised protein [Zhongshania aliphaticivorans]